MAILLHLYFPYGRILSVLISAKSGLLCVIKFSKWRLDLEIRILFVHYSYTASSFFFLLILFSLFLRDIYILIYENNKGAIIYENI